MSEQMNKVLVNMPQGLTTAEQKQGRDNIDAQKTIAYSYQGSMITAIDGSAVGNTASLAYVTHDYNLSGSGTSGSPLGLANPIKFSAQGTAEDAKVSAFHYGSTGLNGTVPSAYTSVLDYRGTKHMYEFPSAEDTAGLGLWTHGQLGTNFLDLSSHDSQYITHNYAGINVDSGLFLIHGYGSGSLQSGIWAAVSGYANGPTMHFQQGTANEYVDIPSIRRWNGISAGVYAGNGLSGSGTSGSPLGMNNPSIISSNNHSSYRGDNFMMVSSNNGDRSYIGDSVFELQHGGSSFSVTTGSIQSWNGMLPISAISADANSAITSIAGSSVGAGNTSPWNESSNALSTGYGGQPVSAASQFVSGAGNWVVRRVKSSGVPDLDMVGFGNTPTGTGSFMVGSNGQWLPYQQNVFITMMDQTSTYLGSSWLPTGVGWPAMAIFWNVSEGDINLMTDTFNGSTADLHPGQSACAWYVPSLDQWRDFENFA